jgi:Bacteriophage tail sheath protein
MANSYRTPGVHIEDGLKFLPSISPVATAIPAFIGYTQKADKETSGDLDFIPTRITSLLEYEEYFGTMNSEIIVIRLSDELVRNGKAISLISRDVEVQINRSKNIMYYQMQLFFANGGNVCYIVSTGRLKSTVSKRALKRGLDKLNYCDEPTMIIFPEGINLTKAEDLYNLYNEALAQSYNLKNRFVIMDIGDNVPPGSNKIDFFRSHVNGGTAPGSLKYGAAYYPELITSMLYRYIDSSVTIIHKTVTKSTGKKDINGTGEFNRLPLNEVLLKNDAVYAAVKNEISKFVVIVPPSSAIAGVYAAVDNSRGVWKAPANIALNNVNLPVIQISDEEQSNLNIDINSGKSINVVRLFPGKGTLIWGGRTLAGNDNEGRYISVCRFFMMVEVSIRNALKAFTSEPNDNNTWTALKSVINNFLVTQWRQGALQGTKQEEAFFVRVGLGETMTSTDVLNRRMIIEIGMATIRPAEFIITTITQLMHVN